MQKLLTALLLTLPSMAFAIDLDGYFITAKGGVSKTMNTGTTSFNRENGAIRTFQDEDLGTGKAFGLSVGKYISDNFRLELEAIKRTSYEFDAAFNIAPEAGDKADIDSKSLFINAFYDFKSFDISSTSVTPYLGGGVGISRNKVGSQKQKSSTSETTSSSDSSSSDSSDSEGYQSVVDEHEVLKKKSSQLIKSIQYNTVIIKFINKIFHSN